MWSDGRLVQAPWKALDYWRLRAVARNDNGVLAAGGLRKDLGPEELAELALKLAMERLEAKAKTA
jgi:hypothetical protein